MTREPGTPARNVADAQDAAGYLWTLDADAVSVYASRSIPPTYRPFGFHATEIRRQGQYTYAHLSILWEMAELSWSTLCIDRPEDRAKLALAAWKAAPEPVRHAVPLAELSRFVDQFCAGLWGAWCDANPQPTGTAFTGGIAL